MVPMPASLRLVLGFSFWKLLVSPTYGLKHATACRSTANDSWGPLPPPPPLWGGGGALVPASAFALAGARAHEPLLPQAPVSAQRLPEVHGEFVAADVDLGAAVPGKGRGVLTREAVPRHHLVLASRAFATAVDPPDPEGLGAVDAATGAAVGASECLLIDAVIRELVADPSRAPELYALDAGPEYQHRPSPDGATAVDVGRVRGIVRTNALRLPSRKGVWRGRAAEPRGSGLWLRAALFNHSCTPNCMWLQVRRPSSRLMGWGARVVHAGSADPSSNPTAVAP